MGFFGASFWLQYASVRMAFIQFNEMHPPEPEDAPKNPHQTREILLGSS